MFRCCDEASCCICCREATSTRHGTGEPGRVCAPSLFDEARQLQRRQRGPHPATVVRRRRRRRRAVIVSGQPVSAESGGQWRRHQRPLRRSSGTRWRRDVDTRHRTRTPLCQHRNARSSRTRGRLPAIPSSLINTRLTRNRWKTWFNTVHKVVVACIKWNYWFTYFSRCAQPSTAGFLEKYFSRDYMMKMFHGQWT